MKWASNDKRILGYVTRGLVAEVVHTPSVFRNDGFSWIFTGNVYHFATWLYSYKVSGTKSSGKAKVCDDIACLIG